MDKKDETSTNHFSVKLRTLLFTIWFDFMTLTQNFDIGYFEQKRSNWSIDAI